MSKLQKTRGNLSPTNIDSRMRPSAANVHYFVREEIDWDEDEAEWRSTHSSDSDDVEALPWQGAYREKINSLNRAVYNEILKQGFVSEQDRCKEDAVGDIRPAELVRFRAIFGSNAFGGPKGAALYLSASRFNHSCTPNLSWANRYNPQTTIRLYTIKDVSAGEELVFNYIDVSCAVDPESARASDDRRSRIERLHAFIANLEASDDKRTMLTEELTRLRNLEFGTEMDKHLMVCYQDLAVYHQQRGELIQAFDWAKLGLGITVTWAGTEHIDSQELHDYVENLREEILESSGKLPEWGLNGGERI
ncbi:hypothetical protein K402DRAFT_456479 [Aulographum hederae CBS 113979]|uniref:SET domain-containing protein n=1 Tax=Aulographum hederae CBS 113979 TaxID=1176131 RepID=A0A6G1GRT0_9PEZI|nr:hypothetical protein K402DRAFT_456479 [Aulographum hederae CBS 113979]